MATFSYMPNGAPELLVQQTVLELIRICGEESICADNLRVDIAQDMMRFGAHNMTMRIVAYVWGKIDSTETYTHPKTWWDAVKLRWFPKRWLKRWPAEMTTIKVQRGGVYPMLAGQRGVNYQTIAVYNAEGNGW